MFECLIKQFISRSLDSDEDKAKYYEDIEPA